MSNKKEIWTQQRKEREKAINELKIRFKEIDDKLSKTEIETSMECQNQMKNQIEFINTEYSLKTKEEIDLYKSKIKEIEDKYRTQELLDKEKLKDDFIQRLFNLVNEERHKAKDAEDKARMKEREVITAAKLKHQTEINALIESMNTKFSELEDKLMARERELIDGNTGAEPTDVATPAPQTATDSTARESQSDPTKDVSKFEPWKKLERLETQNDTKKTSFVDSQVTDATKAKIVVDKKAADSKKDNTKDKPKKGPKDPKDPKNDKKGQKKPWTDVNRFG